MLSIRSLKRLGEQFHAWMVKNFPYLIDQCWYPMECFTLRLVTLSSIDMDICLLFFNVAKLSLFWWYKSYGSLFLHLPVTRVCEMLLVVCDRVPFHDWLQLLQRIGPATEKLKGKGIDFSLWYKPDNYYTEL